MSNNNLFCDCVINATDEFTIGFFFLEVKESDKLATTWRISHICQIQKKKCGYGTRMIEFTEAEIADILFGFINCSSRLTIESLQMLDFRP